MKAFRLFVGLSLLVLPANAVAGTTLWNDAQVGMTRAELNSVAPCKPASAQMAEHECIGKKIDLFGMSFFPDFMFNNDKLFRVRLQRSPLGAAKSDATVQAAFSQISSALQDKYGRPVNSINETMGIVTHEVDYLSNGISVKALYLGGPMSSISITYESTSGASTPL